MDSVSVFIATDTPSCSFECCFALMDGAAAAAEPYTERLRNLQLERKAARARALELKREIKKETTRKKCLLSKTRRFTAAELFSAARKAEIAQAGHHRKWALHVCGTCAPSCAS